MGLINEAAYLYVLAKELVALNKSLKKLAKKAHKHKKKYEKVGDQKKEKHRLKHALVMGQIEKITKIHNEVLAKLKHHQVAFAHSLVKEHKI